MRWLLGLVASLWITALAEAASFSMIQAQSAQHCDITKNINTDFGAVGSGLVNDTPAFFGTGSFNDWAVNTYQPANPGKTICLTLPSGNRYFFGTFGAAIFDGIKSLIVNGSGAIVTNALNLSASASAAGQSVLTLSTNVPSGVTTGMAVIDDTNSTALNGSLSVQSLGPGANQVTLSGTISSPGVSSGDTISFAGGGFFFGTNGETFDNAHSATVQTVSAGAICVTLTNSTQASIFTSIPYGLLKGVDQQGFGEPQNNNRWEYVQISSVDASHQCDGITAGASVHFVSPLKYSYESTWPQYNAGDAFHINQGGPATLFALSASWDATHVYNGLTNIAWDGPGATVLNTNGRSITFNGCSFPGGFGVNFSQQKWLALVGCTMPNIGAQETDKLWETATVTGGTYGGFNFFSASGNDTFNLNGVHLLNDLRGTPGTLNIVNSSVDGGVKLGALSNGVTQTVNCSNSNLGTGGIYGLGGAQDATTATGVGVTMSGGVITVPRTTEGPMPWAVPGAHMYWFGDAPYQNPFTVVDITSDATNTYIQTDGSGGFPAFTGQHKVKASPARKLNFVGCSGSTSVLDISQAGARNAEWGTYSNRIYTCTNNVATVQAANPGVPVIDMNSPPSGEPFVVRTLSSLSVAVSQADTSANATVNFQLGGQFNNGAVYLPSGSTATFAPIINLKVAGTRSYNGSTSTWSGGQSGDTLGTVPNPSYMPGGPFIPFTSVNVSGETAGQCPVVTLTVQTN